MGIFFYFQLSSQIRPFLCLGVSGKTPTHQKELKSRQHAFLIKRRHVWPHKVQPELSLDFPKGILSKVQNYKSAE